MALTVETVAGTSVEGGEGYANSRAGLRSYPLDLEWRRGAKLYVARLSITGTGHLERSFLRGRVVKSRNVLEYKAGDVGDVPTWLTRRPLDSCPTCAQPRPISDSGEEVLAAFGSGWANYGLVFGTSDLLDIVAAGTPGAPGAWMGDRCVTCEVSPVFEVGAECSGCSTAAASRATLEAVADLAEAF